MKARKVDDQILLQMIDQGKTQKQIAAHFKCSPAAVCKRLKKLSIPESFKNLSDKEQTFVTEIVSGRSQTQAALLAYDVTNRESAKSLGHRLMKDTDIQTAVAELMQEEGLTKRYRVRRLKTHVDAKDPTVSLKALEQSWKLDGAYTEKHVHIEVNYEDMCKRLKSLLEKAEEMGIDIYNLDDETEALNAEPVAQITEGEKVE